MNARQSSLGIVLGAVLGLLLPTLATAADAPYSEGQIIELTGAVTDAAGNVQPGKTVVLQVYRLAFGLSSLNPRDFGKNRKGLIDRTVVTDDRGRYVIQWPWHDYYNRFELSVGDFGATGFEVLEKIDLSRRILRGAPIITSFILDDPQDAHAEPAAASTTPVTAAAPTMDSSQSMAADQRALRDRKGEPDQIDTLDLAYGRETTWWYFAAGQAYRFLDGELRDEMAFDPVRSH